MDIYKKQLVAQLDQLAAEPTNSRPMIRAALNSWLRLQPSTLLSLSILRTKHKGPR